MTDSLKKKLVLYRDKATTLEKEVVDLIIESIDRSESYTYQDFATFLKNIAEQGLNSGIIPKFLFSTERIAFYKRNEGEIWQRVRKWEEKHNTQLIIEKGVLSKADIAKFGFMDASETIINELQKIILTEEKPEVSREARRKELERNLPYFTGTENWHQIYKKPQILATDGMVFVMKTAEAFWLSDLVYSIQGMKAIKEQPFQCYDLTVNLEKSTALMIVTDGNENELYRQEIPFTTFPLPCFKFYFYDLVMLLPSEY